MNTSHTPGPWRVTIGILHPTGKIGDTKSTDIRVYAPPENESRWVADCGHFYSKEQQANAQLIAAAPDLLEAVLLAHKYMGIVNFDYEESSEQDQDLHTETYLTIQDALFKATGQIP